MAVKVITFDRFFRGEFGRMAPWTAPPGSFTGKNVVVYSNGLIGPRNGLKEIIVSGIPGSTIVGMGRNDQAGEANNRANFVIQGTAVRLFKDDGTSLSTTSTSLATTPPEPPAYITRGQLTYLSVTNDKLYKIDHAAATLTAISTPNSPGLRCLAQYGERTMAGGPGGKAPDGAYTLDHRYYRQEPSPLVPDTYIDGLIHLVAAEAFRNARQMSRVEEAWAAWSRWLAVARDNINRSRAPLTVVVREGHPF